MTDEILTACLQFFLNKCQGLAVLLRFGETRWIGHPKHITRFGADDVCNRTANSYLNTFYLVEQKLAQFTVKLV